MQILFSMNIYDVITNVLLQLSAKDLHSCRQVCHEWNNFILRHIWYSKKGRRVLNERLKNNWLSLQYKKFSHSTNNLVISNFEVKTFGQYILIHPQLYTYTSQPSSIKLIHKNTAETIREREVSGRLEYVDFGSNFIVLGYETRENSCSISDTVQILRVPDCCTLGKITLPLEQSKELYCVSDNTVLFLSAYKNSLDVCQFTVYNPVTRDKRDFILCLCITDVLCLKFDGEYALVRTISDQDRLSVIDVNTTKFILKDFPYHNFTLNQVFKYPLYMCIEDHSILHVFNLKTLATYSYFIHTNLRRNTEIGLLNRMVLSKSGFLFISRYEKFTRDHSNCCSQVDIFDLDLIKYGIFQPVVLKIRENGPLFDNFHVDGTKLVVSYSSEKRIDLFDFWS